MITCPNCNSENIDSANFCLSCGSSLATVKIPPSVLSDSKRCPYCAEDIKKDAFVCRYCGHNLREETIQESPNKPKRISNPYLGFLGLLIIGVVVVLAFTNPKKAAHTNMIYSTLGEVAGQQLGGNTGGILGKLFGQTIGTISNWLDVSLFDYNNYIVFSTTSLGGRVITVGYLTNVNVVAPVEEWINDISSLADINLGNNASPTLQPDNTAPQSNTSSVISEFEYPLDGQTLDYTGDWLFKIKPIANAQGYLWGFDQNGRLVWENWRDEHTLSSNEYSILVNSDAHSKFAPGRYEIWVRGYMDNGWTDPIIITIYLR